MSVLPLSVLCLSGHDPTGGAGIQADIETLNGLGCHPCTVITALTVQDSRNVSRVLPQRKTDFLEQARTLMADLPIAAVKIGLLGSAEIGEAVAELLLKSAPVPVVLDPVLAAGGGQALAREDLIAVIRSRLLPLTTVMTPNIPEALTLAGGDGALPDCAQVLRRLGCGQVLITGTHDEDTADVINRLYGADGETRWRWQRLPFTYHGSGCTLASALAGFLAQGVEMREAAYRAQVYTWQALKEGRRLGKGQHFPWRRSVPLDSP